MKIMEWISTEDRLPENGEKVLCIYGFRFASNPKNKFSLKKEPIIGMYISNEEKWYAVDSVFCFGDSCNEITGDRDNNKTHEVKYWMPLPKAPMNI